MVQTALRRHANWRKAAVYNLNNEDKGITRLKKDWQRDTCTHEYEMAAFWGSGYYCNLSSTMLVTGDEAR